MIHLLLYKIYMHFPTKTTPFWLQIQYYDFYNDINQICWNVRTMDFERHDVNILMHRIAIILNLNLRDFRTPFQNIPYII